MISFTLTIIRTKAANGVGTSSIELRAGRLASEGDRVTVGRETLYGLGTLTTIFITIVKKVVSEAAPIIRGAFTAITIVIANDSEVARSTVSKLTGLVNNAGT